MTCPIGTDIPTAAEILQSGGIVAFATETVYGLGANAFDAAAVARIFAVKQRPSFDPLIVHIAELEQWNDLAPFRTELVDRLAAEFWPGPLSLVADKSPIVPDLVTAGLTSVAMRMPAHPVARELLQACALPVAAPSANQFGQISPTTAEHVAAQLGDQIDYILDGGPCAVGLESTVLDVTREPPVILRPGGLTRDRIESAIGPVAVSESSTNRPDEQSAQLSPGMLSKHYAPHKPLTLFANVQITTEALPALLDTDKQLGLLTAQPEPDLERYFVAAEILSPSGDMTEAAANLFAAMHRLDSAGCNRIIAIACPDTGLGSAINDRLRRAAE